MCFFPNLTRAEGAASRGLFVSLVQDPPTLSSHSHILKLVDFAKTAHINILFVQIYRANQAWFPSKTTDDKPYQIYLKTFSEDPLGLLIQEAHRSGIKVHAWLNLLSLSNNKEASFIKKYGLSILTRNSKDKKTIDDYKIDDQYFLEPSDPHVRRDLSRIVGEILQTYPSLDGIQFDYIRYPDVHPSYGYTQYNMEQFKKKTAVKTISEKDPLWRQWKRDQVTQLLKELVHKAQQVHPGIQVSTTGCVSYIRAYEEAFQDWPSWLKMGLVDFVTIMSYPTDTLEFQKNIFDAQKRTTNFKKINIAVGAYKPEHSPAVFKENFQLCQESGGGACVIFHYGSVLQKPAIREYLISGSRPQAEPSQIKKTAAQ